MMEEIEKLCDRLELARYRTDLRKERKSERRSHCTIREILMMTVN